MFTIMSPVSSYVYANNNPVLYQDEYGLGILNVIGNLFQRAVHSIGTLFSGGCRCNGFGGDSISEAWMARDFPSNDKPKKTNNKPSGSTAQNTNPKPSITPIAINNSTGIIVPDFYNYIPDINPSATLIPNILGRDRSPDGITRPPLPTNVEFNRNIQFNQNSTSLYDKALTEKTLYDLISTLQEHAELKLVISANSSYTQNDNYGVTVDGGNGTVGSLKLGRAKAIKKLLIKKGIDPNRILIKKGRDKDYSTTFELKK